MQATEKTEPTELQLSGELIAKFKSPEVVRQNIKKFREFQSKLLDPEVDVAIIQGKPFTRKSGWNVINQFWGTETKPINSWRIELPDGEYAYVVVVEASQPGRLPESRSGYCSTLEMKAKHGGKTYSRIDADCHAMAETRAVGRVSAAWYMVSDVSAEEIEGGPLFEDHPQTTLEAKKDYCSCKIPKQNPTSKNFCITCKKEIHP